MSRPRTFDYDEAARLRKKGLTYQKIGDLLGVSGFAVARAVDPERRARHDAAKKAYLYSAICPDCGGPRNRYHPRCWDCSVKAKTTSVRPDELYCSSCKKWKPDSGFAHSVSTPHRRNHHKTCTECNTAMKRAWRERNRERTRAWDRAYKRKVRAA